MTEDLRDLLPAKSELDAAIDRWRGTWGMIERAFVAEHPGRELGTIRLGELVDWWRSLSRWRRFRLARRHG